MQQKLPRLLKSLPVILARLSCEAATEVWVALSHTASEKEATGEIYFYLPKEQPYLSLFIWLVQQEPHGPPQVTGTNTAAWPSETVTSATGSCWKTRAPWTTLRSPNSQHSHLCYLLGNEVLFSTTALFRGKVSSSAKGNFCFLYCSFSSQVSW